MPALRTEITEIVTGLGMLDADDLDGLLDAEVPRQLRNVDAATWGRLRAARGDRAHDGDFLAAWNTGGSPRAGGLSNTCSSARE